MFFIILAFIFLGSFTLLFGVWLVVWSIIMRPKLKTSDTTAYQIFKKI